MSSFIIFCTFLVLCKFCKRTRNKAFSDPRNTFLGCVSAKPYQNVWARTYGYFYGRLWEGGGGCQFRVMGQTLILFTPFSVLGQTINCQLTYKMPLICAKVPRRMDQSSTILLTVLDLRRGPGLMGQRQTSSQNVLDLLRDPKTCGSILNQIIKCSWFAVANWGGGHEREISNAGR